MKRISRALYKATQRYPYYARGFAALTPVKKLIKSGGRATVGVDKNWRLYFSDEALEEFKYSEASVMCHELEHLLRDHAGRCNDRNQKVWNIACDAEINDDIESMPPWCVMPQDLGLDNGLCAEEYYDNKTINIDRATPVCGGGSGVTGVAEEWEIGDGDCEGDLCGVESFEVESLRDAIARDVIDEVQKNPGSVPLGVKLWAEARAEGKLPRLSWRRLIKNKLRNIAAGATDYSYVRASRRQEPKDKVLLPGKIAYRPTLSVVIDTSGSMSSNATANWIAGVLRDVIKMRATTKLIDCDAAVHAVRELKNWRDVLKSRGGGGTNMCVGIEKAIEIKSDIILILSDGYTPWPKPWPRNAIALLFDESSCGHANGRIYNG